MKTSAEVQKEIIDNARTSAAVAETYIGHPEQASRHHVISCNHIARTIAYRLNDVSDDEILVDDNARIIHLLDEDCVIRQYNVKKISVSHKGLVCYILKPTHESNNNNRVHLVFRGTKDSSAWARNINDTTPGYTTLMENSEVILEEVLNAIAADKSHIIVSGHSLGGADAQNFFNIIMQKIFYAKSSANLQIESTSQNTLSSKLLKVAELTLNASNPAGVSKLVWFAAKIHSDYLSENGIKISAVYILAAGDIVPQSGQAHILSDSNIQQANIYLAKFSDTFSDNYLSGKNVALTGIGGVALGLLSPLTGFMLSGFGALSTLHAHKTKVSIEQLLDGKFEMYSNITTEGQQIISTKLGKHVLDNSLVSQSQLMFSSFMFRSNNDSMDSSNDSPTSLSLTQNKNEEEWVIVPHSNKQKFE